MIIGEKNLIIGKIFSVISETSITLFYYIYKQINYIFKECSKITLKIIPISNSPPYSS